MSHVVVDSRMVNLDKFEAKLKELDKDTRSEVIVRALCSGALLIQNQAKENVHAKLNTTGLATGTLARSIHIGSHTELANDFSGGEGYSDIGSPKPRGFKASVRIGTNLVYAAIHEFGGVIHAKKAPALVFKTADGQWHRVTSVTIPPRPYLRPAWDKKINAAVKEVGVALGKLIEEAMR